MLFDQNVAGEREIRQLADTLYRRADHAWARNPKKRVSHGWRPEDGFIPHDWHGYDEALFLYVLALGAPDAPLDPDSYARPGSRPTSGARCSASLIHSAPLFTHQFPQLFLDLRGLEDAACAAAASTTREHPPGDLRPARLRRGESGRLRLMVPTAGASPPARPGPERHVVDGRQREFLGYHARGVPEPDDGTLSPWVVSARCRSCRRSCCRPWALLEHRPPARALRPDLQYEPDFRRAARWYPSTSTASTRARSC
jgi:hypothetical protein